MDKKKISRACIQTTYPITPTLLAWIFLDYYHAPGWVSGMVWTIIVLLWIVVIVELFECEMVDIFKK